MKIEHELFAHHYILTGDKEAAYRKAYPKASGEALKIAARKLINRPEVRDYITQQLTAVRREAADRYQEEQQQQMEAEKATMLLKRKKLCDIIEGRAKQKKYFKFKDRIEVIEVDYTPFEVMRAIELDTKIENEWYRRYGKQNAEPAQHQSKPEKDIRELERRYIKSYERTEFLYGPDYMAGLRAEMVRDNPHMAKQYAEKGLRVLDYIPSNEDLERMKAEHEKRFEEWREHKKFIEEREDEYEAIIHEIEQGNRIIIPDLPDPASLPTTNPGQHIPKIMTPHPKTR
ncbi:MAG: hypothetical protein H6550_10455 [Chitinophagales bacterium]|nr:hypothetical protein [Chitinophagales bacterium]